MTQITDNSDSPLRVDPSSDVLIVVDMQNDFVLPTGSLSVADSESIIPRINHLSNSYPFRLRIATLDWHPHNHCSFVPHGGQWPVHCVRDSPGAQLHHEIDTTRIDRFVHKGGNVNADSYSAFEDDAGVRTELSSVLESRGVRRIFVCGVAFDYCVYFTVMDALKYKYEVIVIEDLCRGVDSKLQQERRCDMLSKGVRFVSSLSLENQ